MIVLSGLSSKPPANSPAGAAAGVHARASTRVPDRRASRSARRAPTSRPASRSTRSRRRSSARRRSWRRSSSRIEGRDFAGSCDAGYSCAYTNTISWRSATTPLPMENDPRAVFERLFGDGDSTDPAARLAPHRGRPQHPRLGHRADRRSAAAARAARPRQARRVPRGGPRRRAAHPEGRGAERRASCRSSISRPASRAASRTTRKLMFDLQVLAYQTDLTRVITFMIGARAERPHLSARSACRRRITRSRTTRTIRRSWRTWPRSTCIHMPLFAYYLEKLRRHAGRRRLAARSRDDHLRRGHGRQQPARPEQPAGAAGRRRRGHAARRPPPHATRSIRRWRTCT